MVAKLFTAPFAKDGDKTPIPNQLQLDGSVSYEAGFGADYERQLGVDPAAKNLRRQSFNELQFDITTALQELQSGAGTSVFNLGLAQALPGGGYPKGAVIPRLDGLGLWVNTVAANTTNPDTGGAGWSAIFADGSNFAVDTGIVNAYTAAFSPAVVARSPSRFLSFKVKISNTGASTFNDGLGAAPLLGASQQPLQGGELVANGLALVFWNATVNSYVLAFSSGGQLPVLAGKSSLHAVNVLQVQNQTLTYFSSTGTGTAQVLTPAPAIAAYVAGQRFAVMFNAVSGVNPTLNVSARGAKAIKQYGSDGSKLAASFVVGQVADLVYDGVDFIMLGPLPTASLFSPGDIVITSANTAPLGTLKCNGASDVSRTAYAALFAKIGTTYGAGDGSTTFTLPEARAEGIRGWDDGRGIDVGRTLGSSQLDSIRNVGIYSELGNPFGGGGGAGAGYLKTAASSGVIIPAGVETRGRNIAFLVCIRY